MIKNTLKISVKFCEKHIANDLHTNIANTTFELKENDIECPIYMLESNKYYQSIERTRGTKYWVGIEPGAFGSTRLYLTTTPQRQIT